MVDKKIIFFDGVCNLCNSFVNYCIDRNEKQDLLFAPIQSSVAEQLIPSEKSILLNNPLEASVVFYKDGLIFLHSQAVFEILKELSGWIRLLRVFSLFPEFLTDWGYRLIARNRYRLFGKKDTCRIPTPELKNRFLI
ncbi:MAG: DUF393 domain-containing protein [Leptospira sp.]|nr:DUF393 domain-containing protein [Leptospira sp.]